MRCIAWTAVTLALFAIANGAEASVVDQFADFKKTFGRKYASPEEEAKRFRIFAQNMEKAAALQASNPHATFGATEFADLSAEEFKSRHNADRVYAEAVKKMGELPTDKVSRAQKVAAAGQKIDWRQRGAVTQVKNQGQCGSCWSFSTTGGIEGQWYLAGHDLVSLSEQMFVSCDTIDHGCKGGLMDNAYNWVLTTHNGSLVTEASYPYVSGDGVVPACNMNNTQFGAQIVSYKNVEHNEDAMAAWSFANGPLSIAVDAQSWQMYTGGIMTNCQGVGLDHGVLIVGFDDTFEMPYWIIKNSWGPIWGEQGYIRVQKGTNQCLITGYPTSAHVTSVGPTPTMGPTSSPIPTPPPGTPKPPKPFPKGWVNLMYPPYMDGPQMMMGMSCISNSSCYIAGGSNGVGFGVFRFNGEWEGYFRSVQLQAAGGMAMYMAVGAGGTEANPHGAAGGMDFGADPQYFTGPLQMNNSLAIPFVVTQSITADRATGMHVMFADGFDGNEEDYWVSTNGGYDYASIKVRSSLSLPNCTFPNGQVIVDENTWYVVSGGNPAPPPNPNPPPPPFAKSQKAKRPFGRREASFARKYADADKVEILNVKNPFHAIVQEKETGKVKHAFVNLPEYLEKQQPLKEIGCPFTAAIQKTTDGGKTWTTVFENVGGGYEMYNIDCANATHCVAVGGGSNASDTPGARVFTTTDGATFTETMNIPMTKTDATFINGVQFVPGGNGEVWLAGAVQTQTGGNAVFWVSKDAGKTWSEKQQVDFVMAITALSFANDGTGFATGLTPLQDSTVLRYTPTGAPITPAPIYNGPFTQSVYNTSGSCHGPVQSMQFPQNTCLNMTNGFSASISCDLNAGMLIQKVYPLDKVCWGPAEEQVTPLGICLPTQQGTIEFTCGPSSSQVAVEKDGAKLQLPKKH